SSVSRRRTLPRKGRHRRLAADPTAGPRGWAVPGSNGRPPRCKRGALPTELTAQTGESSIRPLERPAVLEGTDRAVRRGRDSLRDPRPDAQPRLLRGLGLARGPGHLAGLQPRNRPDPLAAAHLRPLLSSGRRSSGPPGHAGNEP